MKNYKQFIAGVVVGGVLLSGGNVLANNAGLPSITNWVKYKINGEYKALLNGYTTLNYQDHTYVPTRFIAEQLGAEVEWDDKTNTVSIATPVKNIDEKPSETEDKSESTPKEEESDKYDELPVSKTINGVRVEVYAVEERTDYTKLYIMMKNTTDNLVQLQQGTAYFQSKINKKYANNDMGEVLYWKDSAWFKDIGEDEDQEGFIMLPPIPEDEKQGKFYVEVFENTLNGNTLKYEFDIKW